MRSLKWLHPASSRYGLTPNNTLNPNKLAPKHSRSVTHTHSCSLSRSCTFSLSLLRARALALPISRSFAHSPSLALALAVARALSAPTPSPPFSLLPPCLPLSLLLTLRSSPFPSPSRFFPRSPSRSPSRSRAHFLPPSPAHSLALALSRMLSHAPSLSHSHAPALSHSLFRLPSRARSCSRSLSGFLLTPRQRMEGQSGLLRRTAFILALHTCTRWCFSATTC
jgi:hypothetical protein